MGWLKDSNTHLNSDPVAACSDCKRITYKKAAIGTTCNMPQPDETRCKGTFVVKGASNG
jgi:hypothetical protein